MKVEIRTEKTPKTLQKTRKIAKKRVLTCGEQVSGLKNLKKYPGYIFYQSAQLKFIIEPAKLIFKTFCHP